ncbi:MAG: alkaline phosphatase family protein [Candidatus Krumholzibacteriota bacterium]|nr:alkaline phosphatase family protein [Candidatus Krumholzibacteriota bacterium]
MKRLVIIGMDGMDWPLLERFLPRLPAFSRLAASGYGGELEAIFPPDSIPSWISIFTGLDPSHHGILETIDYFKKDAREFSVDTGAFRGRTFWDEASRAGKKVIVVNPLMAFPPWEVNGIMASGPVFISGETATWPGSAAQELELPALGGIVDFPDQKDLAGFYDKTREETYAIVDFTAKLMERRPWDLTFVTLLTLDRILHFFWRYYDREDPTYPGPNRHEDRVADFHLFLDKCVERLIEAAGEDALFMIISDHGHARRPPLLFNLNQLLMENGLLESRIRGPKLLSPRYHVERAKNFTLETLHRLDLEDLSYKFAHLFPWTRKLKRKDFMTSPRANLATASGFGGTNPFGGIDVSRQRCREEGVEYEELRDRIIGLLLRQVDKEGHPCFLWARRREEMFAGPFINRYPDILYEMQPRYGTNWSLHLPLITLNPRHRKISGGHRKNSVLVAGPLQNWEVVPEKLTSLNIAASALSWLESGAESGRPPAAGESFLRRKAK